MLFRSLKPTNKIGAAFGSFGWSGESVKLLNEAMAAMKFDVVDDGLKVKYVPEDEDFAHCIELGRKVGRALNAKTSEKA